MYAYECINIYICTDLESFILKNIKVGSSKSESVKQIGELEIPGRVEVSMLSSKSNWKQNSFVLADFVYIILKPSPDLMRATQIVGGICFIQSQPDWI